MTPRRKIYKSTIQLYSCSPLLHTKSTVQGLVLLLEVIIVPPASKCLLRLLPDGLLLLGLGLILRCSFGLLGEVVFLAVEGPPGHVVESSADHDCPN
jgi:hypothetical protein